MHTSAFIWSVTIAFVVGLFLFDFIFHLRKPHAPTLRESTIWSVLYVGIALVFGVGVMLCGGPTTGGEYFTAYLTEKALSVDNMFVFLLIMSSLAVPRHHQQKALLFGIGAALLLRTVMIIAGAALIGRFTWSFYLFGIILIVAACRLLRPDDSGNRTADNFIVRATKRILPITDTYDGDKLVTVRHGRRSMTPMMLAMIGIGSTDVVFALDSVPAIFGITQNTYLVFTATAFALLGLRQLYFLIDELLRRLIYLSYALAVILGVIGIKLVAHALHENSVPLINDGRPVEVIEIGTLVTLVVIVAILAIAIGASLVVTRGRVRATISSTRRYATAYLDSHHEGDFHTLQKTYAKMLEAEQQMDALPLEERKLNSVKQVSNLVNKAHAKHREYQLTG